MRYECLSVGEGMDGECRGMAELIQEIEKMQQSMNAVLSNLAVSAEQNSRVGQFAHWQAYSNAYNMAKSVFNPFLCGTDTTDQQAQDKGE